MNSDHELIKRDLYRMVFEWAIPILEKNEYVHREVIQKMERMHANFQGNGPSITETNYSS